MARPDRGSYPTSDDASRRWADPVQGCPLAQGQASRHSSPTNASLITVSVVLFKIFYAASASSSVAATISAPKVYKDDLLATGSMIIMFSCCASGGSSFSPAGRLLKLNI